MQTHYSKMVLNFKKRTNMYSNTTGSLTFNPETCEAHSYRWWKFVAKVEGLVVFNIDLFVQLPKGINSSSLQDLLLTQDEYLSEKFIRDEEKKITQNERAKQRRFKKKLEHYLENVVHFRDYEIKPKSQFGKYNKIAVHQVVEDIENDVSNALHSFHRDGFGNVVFYVGV